MIVIERYLFLSGILTGVAMSKNKPPLEGSSKQSSHSDDSNDESQEPENNENNEANKSSFPSTEEKAKEVGLNWEEIKEGFTRFLPVLETVANMTDNKFDNAVIEFIKVMIAN